MIATTASDAPIFVDSEFVSSHRDELVLADVRWRPSVGVGAQLFASGHIPGAVFVDIDIDRDLADPPAGTRGRHPLPSAERFAVALSALGIGDDAVVVAYDDLGGATAGRLVWLLRAIGTPTSLLDGGIGAWVGPLEAGQPAAPPRAHRGTVAWPPNVFQHLGDLDAMSANDCLLDARSEVRYRGESEPIDAVAGHIPGARSLAYESLLHPVTGRIASKDEIRRRIHELGVDRSGTFVASCGSGVTACALLLALEHADLGTGALFNPSWSGWIADPTRQVHTGAQP